MPRQSIQLVQKKCVKFKLDPPCVKVNPLEAPYDDAVFRDVVSVDGNVTECPVRNPLPGDRGEPVNLFDHGARVGQKILGG